MPFNVNANTSLRRKFPVFGNAEDLGTLCFNTGHVYWPCNYGHVDEQYARQRILLLNHFVSVIIFVKLFLLVN